MDESPLSMSCRISACAFFIVHLQRLEVDAVHACRDGRRFIWAIDGWSERRKQPVIRSDSFNLTGSERTWVLSRTAETDSLHLTCSGAAYPTLDSYAQGNHDSGPQSTGKCKSCLWHACLQITQALVGDFARWSSLCCSHPSCSDQ